MVVTRRRALSLVAALGAGFALAGLTTTETEKSGSAPRTRLIRLSNDYADGKPFKVPTQSKAVTLDTGEGRSLDAVVHWPTGVLEQPYMRDLADGRNWRNLQYGTFATEQGATVEFEVEGGGELWIIESYAALVGTTVASYHYLNDTVEHAVDFSAVRSIAIEVGGETVAVFS